MLLRKHYACNVMCTERLYICPCPNAQCEIVHIHIHSGSSSAWWRKLNIFLLPSSSLFLVFLLFHSYFSYFYFPILLLSESEERNIVPPTDKKYTIGLVLFSMWALRVWLFGAFVVTHSVTNVTKSIWMRWQNSAPHANEKNTAKNSLSVCSTLFNQQTMSILCILCVFLILFVSRYILFLLLFHLCCVSMFWNSSIQYAMFRALRKVIENGEIFLVHANTS